ncbi:MAG: 50S ribosomal protein L29 [bacterium]
MKAPELRKMSDPELAEKLEEFKKECFNLRFQLASHQAPNPRRIRAVKRDIAKIKTIQRERELNIERASSR